MEFFIANTTYKENFIAYKGAHIDYSQFGKSVIIGESSYILQSLFEDGVQINRRNLIDNAHIGRYTYTGQNTVIKRARIGPFCSISWNVSIGGAEHEYKRMTTHPFPLMTSFGFVQTAESYPTSELPLEIGADVWIGAGASILRGVKIGDGAIVGTNAVVTHDILPYAIAAGVPAKIIKFRFSQQKVEELSTLRWWEWPDEKIKQNIHLFQRNVE